MRSRLHVKRQIVRDEQVEFAITIVIEKGAAGAKAWLGTEQAGLFRDIGERTVAVIPVERVLLPAGDENVFKTVVVVVADRNAVKIAGAKQACTLSHVGKRAIAVVFIKTIGGFARRIAKPGAGENQDIEPVVVVVVEESGPQLMASMTWSARREWPETTGCFNPACCAMSVNRAWKGSPENLPRELL